MPDYIEICEKAARAGAVELMQWRHRFEAKEKGPKDLVTEADLASQQAIQRVISSNYPDHRFVGEEDGFGEDVERATEGLCWIVDPLDGTTNYVHQMPAFSVSVALCRDGQPLVGVILDPILDECFSAIRGEGAWLNGSRIHASDQDRLDYALLAASFSANVREDSEEIVRFVRVLCRCQALRRLGSAALNMAYVACGRLDGYWATSVKAWDVAAGALLVEEAGATLSGMDGGPFRLERPKLITASTLELHTRLRGVLDGSSRDESGKIA